MRNLRKQSRLHAQGFPKAPNSGSIFTNLTLGVLVTRHRVSSAYKSFTSWDNVSRTGGPRATYAHVVPTTKNVTNDFGKVQSCQQERLNLKEKTIYVFGRGHATRSGDAMKASLTPFLSPLFLPGRRNDPVARTGRPSPFSGRAGHRGPGSPRQKPTSLFGQLSRERTITRRKACRWCMTSHSSRSGERKNPSRRLSDEKTSAGPGRTATKFCTL